MAYSPTREAPSKLLGSNERASGLWVVLNLSEENETSRIYSTMAHSGGKVLNWGT